MEGVSYAMQLRSYLSRLSGILVFAFRPVYERGWNGCLRKQMEFLNLRCM